MTMDNESSSVQSEKKVSRKQQILESLAHELEVNPGDRITTASLAKAVGVSEAALYRHFPSKAKMFEGLIEFSEEIVFGMISQIMERESHALQRCEKIMTLVLGFSEKNPGITRVLLGQALVGEHERLQKRTSQFFQRIETQLKQVIREGELNQQINYQGQSPAAAGVLIAVVEGAMHRYVRTAFEDKPTQLWAEQWPMLSKLLA